MFPLDPVRMADAARLVGLELEALEPDIDWVSRAESYAAALSAVDRQIESILSVIPTENRKLVTGHNAARLLRSAIRF